MDGIFRRRKLPHWDVEGHAIFITACLEGSISATGLSRIRRFRDELDSQPRPAELDETAWEVKKHKRVFKLVDDLLDHQSANTDLKDPRLAKIVADAFLHFAGDRYDLLAFAVMPSHHHWLFLPKQEWTTKITLEQRTRPNAKQRTPREIISHSIQSYTATMCNRLLGNSGAFWQTETFDHWARDEEELLRIIHYIENNPVKAGLVTDPSDFQFSSARIRKAAGLEFGTPILKTHVG